MSYCLFLAILLLPLTEQSGFRRVRLRHGSPLGCSKCPPGWGVKHQCTPTEDTVCAPCESGSSYSAHNSYRVSCFPCSRCGPGLFVRHPCSVRRDTVCDSCRSTRPRSYSKDFDVKCRNITLTSTYKRQ